MREYHLEELATYGHCPMKWRYRYEYRLPYFEADSQEAYCFSVREALIRYVNTRASGSAHHYAALVSTRAFKKTMDAFDRSNVFTLGQRTKLDMEGHLAMIDFHQRVFVNQEFGPIKSCGDRAWTYVEDAKIWGNFDLILEPRIRDKTKYTLAFCHITNERSSLYSPRFAPMEWGWTTAVVHQHFEEAVSVYHCSWSPWSRNGLSLSKSMYSRAMFTGTVRGLIKGIESRAVWQATDIGRCRKCCYFGICEAAHSRDLKRSEIKELDERMKTWPGRRAVSAAARESSDDTQKE